MPVGFAYALLPPSSIDDAAAAPSPPAVPVRLADLRFRAISVPAEGHGEKQLCVDT